MHAAKSILAIALLSTPAIAVAQQAPVRLERVSRIGCVECEGPEMFSGIQTLAVSGNRVIVTDASAPFVRVFDAGGRTVRAFGRKGSGPGEFQLPIHAGPRAGGALEVYDMTLRRFTRFDSTGAVLSTRLVPGFAVMVVSNAQPAESYMITSDFRSQEQPVLLLADAGKEPSRLLALGPDFPLHAPGEHARTPAFAARPGGGFAVGDGINEYRIRRYDRAGKPLGDIVRTVQRRRKTTEELNQEREQFMRRRTRMQAMRRAEGGPGPINFQPREEWNHFNIDALQFDETGRLWVRTERGGLTATVFDLFDPGGRYLGELRVPEKLRAFAIGSGLLAAKVLDEDEVEYVHIYRITQ
jgi:hypothetical protein